MRYKGGSGKPFTADWISMSRTGETRYTLTCGDEVVEYVREESLELVPEPEPETETVYWRHKDGGDLHSRTDGLDLSPGYERVRVLSEAEWAQIERERKADSWALKALRECKQWNPLHFENCHICRDLVQAYDAARAERSKGNE